MPFLDLYMPSLQKVSQTVQFIVFTLAWQEDKFIIFALGEELCIAWRSGGATAGSWHKVCYAGCL